MNTNTVARLDMHVQVSAIRQEKSQDEYKYEIGKGQGKVRESGKVYRGFT